jgi:hypothetical protein
MIRFLDLQEFCLQGRDPREMGLFSIMETPNGLQHLFLVTDVFGPSLEHALAHPIVLCENLLEILHHPLLESAQIVTVHRYLRM